MLINELFVAVKKTVPCWSEKKVENFSKEYNETIQRLYILDRFDYVFIGSDRHIKCIEWIFNNQKLFNRYHRIINRKKVVERFEIQKKISELKLRLLVL